MEIDELSPREQEVVNLVLQGLTNNEIADKLIISVHTVKAHLVSIYQKLNYKRGKVDIFVNKIKELTNG